MRRARTVLGAVVVGTPFVLGAAAADQPAPGDVAFVMRDHDVVESSGLVPVQASGTDAATDAGGLFATTNDSGDTGRVFTIDAATGETVGVSTWHPDPTDVEALAPAGPGEVWVGDVGDNLRARDHVLVARVPVRPGAVAAEDAPRFRLTHPGGPQDAEALLAHPVTGRLLVVTKGVFGGQALLAPERLDPERDNPLTAVGPVVGIVTDGAFWPDGRHLLLRTYADLHVYSWPDLEHVGGLDLPEQPQGEGLAVTDDGTVLVSTEGRGADGRGSEVLRVALPDDLKRLLAGEGTGGETDGETDDAPAGTPREPAGWWGRLVARIDTVLGGG